MDLAKIKEDPAFGSVIAYLPREVEEVLRFKGAEPGPLRGLPFLVKDLFDVAGWPTTASATFLRSVRDPVKATAAIVQRLEAAGAVCVGKTHLNEFAYGLSGENVHYGDCPHPTDPEALSGGSSSGSAYAVAKEWVPFALGTDTGGSIRVPASFCGVWGVRYAPHFLTEGCFPLAPSFDTVGFFTKTPAVMARINQVIVSQSGPFPVEATVTPLALFDAAWCASAEVANHYIEAFEHRGIAVDGVLSSAMSEWMKRLVKAYSVLQSREAFEVHKDWITPWKEAYDPATYQRIERARHWSEAEVADAGEVMVRFRKWIGEVMTQYPCLVLPVVPTPSPPKPLLSESFRAQLLALTTPGSMACLPAITEPLTMTGHDKTLGLQYLFRGLSELTWTLDNRFR